MDIKIIKCAPDKMKKKPSDESKLGFGKIFTDHMFTVNYEEGRGWHDPVIGRNGKHNHIRHIGPASPHSGERFVARRIEEGDLPIVFGDFVRADVLGDAARFAGHDVDAN